MNRVRRLWVRATAASSGRRLEIYHMVAGLLEARVDLPNALEAAAQSAEARRAPGEAAMVRLWKEADAGKRFDAEIARWTPASETVVFGMSGMGRVEPAALFGSAARVCELKRMLVGAILQAVAMPVFLAFALLAVFWTAGGYLLPELVPLSREHRWMLHTKLLVAIATGLHERTWLFAALGAAGIAAVWTATLYWTGRGRRFLDRFPPFSLYRIVTGCSFLLVALELVASKVELSDDTFAKLRRASSPYGSSRIEAIRVGMAQGLAFGKAMEQAGTGFPEPGLIAVSQALDGVRGWNVELSRFLERWVRRSEQTMTARMAVLRIALQAAVMAGVLGLLGAMFDITQNIR